MHCSWVKVCPTRTRRRSCLTRRSQRKSSSRHGVLRAALAPRWLPGGGCHRVPSSKSVKAFPKTVCFVAQCLPLEVSIRSRLLRSQETDDVSLLARGHTCENATRTASNAMSNTHNTSPASARNPTLASPPLHSHQLAQSAVSNKPLAAVLAGLTDAMHNAASDARVALAGPCLA